MPLPIEGTHYVTQGYGKTKFSQSPAGQKLYKAWGGEHKGFDFGTKGLNLPVVATVVGKIVRASLDGGWGNHVELQGPDDWRRQYAHLLDIACKVGQLVKPGDILGRVGDTGSSTATHLHYGNRKSKLVGWEYRDPSHDFKEVAPTPPKVITSKLIKGNGTSLPDIFVYNGKSKFKVPDMETLRFLFGDLAHELVDQDILSKIPEGNSLPSLK